MGEADKLVEAQISEEQKNKTKFTNYKLAFKKYRYFKRIEIFTRILLYAGVISSAAAVIGFGLEILNRLASYIGISALLILYLVSRYFAVRFREKMYVEREILLSSNPD